VKTETGQEAEPETGQEAEPAAEGGTEYAVANVELAASGRRIEAQIRVPLEPVRLKELIGLFQALSDAITEAAAQNVAETGGAISCRKGCGACCRQLVPVSRMEAWRIRDLVEAMPEPRRSEVKARFEEARRRLEAAGFRERLSHPDAFPVEELHELGRAYFDLGIPCPFLEEESCSIHPDRPLTCREYLVTSSPEYCARPEASRIERVPVGAKVSLAVGRLDPAATGPTIPWVPLSLALEWTDANEECDPPRPGPDIVNDLFVLLAKGASAATAASREEGDERDEGV
jgi:Fe-S-cluster containining protein